MHYSTSQKGNLGNVNHIGEGGELPAKKLVSRLRVVFGYKSTSFTFRLRSYFMRLTKYKMRITADVISTLVIDEHIPTRVINPRRACTARVTVVVLSFCLSVCLLPRFLPLRAIRRLITDTNGFSATMALF